ncbi:MAG: hypothetical protein V4736_14560, partial [Bdellovibrionota bacterium]
INDDGADSVEINADKSLMGFVDQDYDPSVRVHFINSAVVKKGKDTYTITVKKNLIPASEYSMEKYYDGNFVKTNAAGKVTESGKMICNINF